MNPCGVHDLSKVVVFGFSLMRWIREAFGLVLQNETPMVGHCTWIPLFLAVGAIMVPSDADPHPAL